MGSPKESAHTNHKPLLLSSSMVLEILVTLATGVKFIAPAEALTAAAVSPTALFLGITTP